MSVFWSRLETSKDLSALSIKHDTAFFWSNNSLCVFIENETFKLHSAAQWDPCLKRLKTQVNIDREITVLIIPPDSFSSQTVICSCLQQTNCQTLGCTYCTYRLQLEPRPSRLHSVAVWLSPSLSINIPQITEDLESWDRSFPVPLNSLMSLSSFMLSLLASETSLLTCWLLAWLRTS